MKPGYSARCTEHHHRLCRGWRSINDNGGGGARTRCHCPCHQAAKFAGYDPEPVLMPLSWLVYFKARPGILLRVCRGLHVRPNDFREWVSRKRRLVPWQLNRIIAYIELGLLEGGK